MCPYTDHHDADPAFPQTTGWYGLEMQYSLTRNLNALAVTVSGDDMGHGTYGEKSIILDPQNLISPGPRYVKWEGYDNCVTERTTVAVLQFPTIVVAGQQQLAPHHVVREGEYYYRVDASVTDQTLVQRHLIEHLGVQVRYNLNSP
jgi:hypothetical protein